MHLAGNRGNGAPEPTSRTARAGNGAGSLVVLIEDEPTQRSLLTRVLERDGYEVMAIGDGEVGLHAIVQHAPDLVLLDLNLPRITATRSAAGCVPTR